MFSEWERERWGKEVLSLYLVNTNPNSVRSRIKYNYNPRDFLSEAAEELILR